jgi:predicted DNA-binding antitoxin AbrB/MazE fold protein
VSNILQANETERSKAMATQMIEAVYEHGSFRPVAPMDMDLAKGQRVGLAVEQLDDPDAYFVWPLKSMKGSTHSRSIP